MVALVEVMIIASAVEAFCQVLRLLGVDQILIDLARLTTDYSGAHYELSLKSADS